MAYATGDTISFTFGDVAGEIEGTPIQVKATLTQTASGVQVQLQTLAGYNADLYGFFFNIADNSLLGHLVVSDGAVPLILEQDGAVGTTGTNTMLASSNNLNPITPLEVGVQFGSAGKSDDGFRSVTFNIATNNGTSFTLDQLVNQRVGLRAQSAGTGENEDGSSKGTEIVPNPGSLEIIKYLDNNGDHMLSGAEKVSPLSGFTFQLTDTTTNTVVGTLTDGANGDTLDGKVTFGNLTVGHSYSIAEILSADQTTAGWYQTVGENASFTIDTSGEKETAVFGNTQKGSLEVTKYLDANGDGTLSDTETAFTLTGYTFKLFDAQGNEFATLTDGQNGDALDGKVTFGNLIVGQTYRVEEALSPDQTAAGWYQTVGQTAPFTIDTSGEKETAVFGNTQKGSLEVTKYLDANGDGMLSDAEKVDPLPGYTFKLFDAQGNKLATLTDGQNGDALDGKVTFGNLIVGQTYRVEEALSPDQTAAGWYQTVGQTAPFTIDTSGEKETAVFGNTQKGSLEVIKYNDLDGDGMLSAGEKVSPLNGFTFNLFDTTGGGKVFMGTMTDGANGDAADGKVTFSNLFVGHSYSVEEDLSVGPIGWTQTVGSNTSFTINVSAEKETAIFGNHLDEHGTAQTPGFWKNWPAKFNQETRDEFAYAGLSNLKIDTKGSYETYFGVNALGPKAVSFLDALGASGGGENAFLRASAAAFANAATNEINYQIDEAQITAFAGANATAYLDILYAVDTSNDDHIDVAEIKALVSDIYTAGGDYTPANFTSVAAALDAMNNMRHLDSSQIVA